VTDLDGIEWTSAVNMVIWSDWFQLHCVMHIWCIMDIMSSGLTWKYLSF